MVLKLVQQVVKNRNDFRSDLETTFSGYRVDFGSKNRSKLRGLKIICSTSLQICEKCDFEQPSMFFAIFSNFESIDFRP